MYSTIVIAGLVVLTLYIVRMLLRFFVQYYGHIIGVQMQSQMRQDLFAHLEKQPFTFYDNHETGRIMTASPVICSRSANWPTTARKTCSSAR